MCVIIFLKYKIILWWVGGGRGGGACLYRSAHILVDNSGHSLIDLYRSEIVVNTCLD